MRKCEYKMKVWDSRDNFRLAQGYPALFVKLAAAWTVPVATGAGPHLDMSAFFASDQCITKFSGLAGNQRVHNFPFFFGNSMRYAVL